MLPLASFSTKHRIPEHVPGTSSVSSGSPSSLFGPRPGGTPRGAAGAACRACPSAPLSFGVKNFGKGGLTSELLGICAQAAVPHDTTPSIARPPQTLAAVPRAAAPRSRWRAPPGSRWPLPPASHSCPASAATSASVEGMRGRDESVRVAIDGRQCTPPHC